MAGHYMPTHRSFPLSRIRGTQSSLSVLFVPIDGRPAHITVPPLFPSSFSQKNDANAHGKRKSIHRRTRRENLRDGNWSVVSINQTDQRARNNNIVNKCRKKVDKDATSTTTNNRDAAIAQGDDFSLAFFLVSFPSLNRY